MQLSQKQKTFSEFFSIFEIKIKSWTFLKKRWPSELMYFRYCGLLHKQHDKHAQTLSKCGQEHYVTKRDFLRSNCPHSYQKTYD